MLLFNSPPNLAHVSSLSVCCLMACTCLKAVERQSLVNKPMSSTSKITFFLPPSPPSHIDHTT
uniref:Uncharacterized protein n=1 Tax=Phakopsora pachyrhizi TaxID=170000 RepID=A0A0S1MKG8_PHAPC